MREAQLTILLVQALTRGMIARELPVPVKKYNQPRQQGVPTGATVFFQHIFTRNVGWVCRQDVYNKNTSTMVHAEIQNRESRYQVGALAPQSPATPEAPTAADYVAAAAAALQGDATLAFFLANAVGVQRISDVTVTYFVDDKDQNEANPSFDIIFSHQDIYDTSGNVITDYEFHVARV